MRVMRFTLAVLALAVATGAHAFSSTTGSVMDPGTSSRYQDPDDHLPVPHLSDDGTLVPGSSQGIGTTGATFNMLPLQRAPDAFQPRIIPPTQR